VIYSFWYSVGYLLIGGSTQNFPTILQSFIVSHASDFTYSTYFIPMSLPRTPCQTVSVIHAPVLYLYGCLFLGFRPQLDFRLC
jgi:hypothetical protein